MTDYRLTTLSSDKRLVLTSTGGATDWLPKDTREETCVVEAREQGCLYILPLGKWAEKKGVSFPEAGSLLAKAPEAVEPPEVLSVSLAKATRKTGAGIPVWRIALQPEALWALLGPGEGPLGTKFTSKGTRLLVQRGGDGIFVWASPGKALLTSAGLSVLDVD